MLGALAWRDFCCRVAGGISPLTAAPTPDHLGVQLSTFFKLFQRDPFVDRVGLSDIAGAKHDFVFELREYTTVCSVGNGVGGLLVHQFKALFDKVRIRIAVHAEAPVFHVEGQIKLYRRLTDSFQYRFNLNFWHRAQVHGAHALASGHVEGRCVVFDYDIPRQCRRIERLVLPLAFGFGFVAELFISAKNGIIFKFALSPIRPPE